MYRTGRVKFWIGFWLHWQICSTTQSMEKKVVSNTRDRKTFFVLFFSYLSRKYDLQPAKILKIAEQKSMLFVSDKSLVVKICDYWQWLFSYSYPFILILLQNIFTVTISYLIGIYLFNVNNRKTRARWEICSKSTIKTPKRGQWHRHILQGCLPQILHDLFLNTLYHMFHRVLNRPHVLSINQNFTIMEVFDG